MEGPLSLCYTRLSGAQTVRPTEIRGGHTMSRSRLDRRWLPGPRRLALATVATSLAAAAVVGSAGAEQIARHEKPSASRSGTLVVAQVAGVTALDPQTVASAAQYPLSSLLYSALTTTTPGGKRIEPQLATSWKHSAGYTKWTFNLRHGVKFWNGTPFTAALAVKNIQRVLNPKTVSQWRQDISQIKHVSASGKYTLNIVTSQADPLLPLSLTYVYMVDVPSVGSINKTGLGTGPYKVASFVPNVKVDMVRNPKYWGSRPGFKAIDFVTYPDTTAAETAFAAGQVQAIYNVPATDVTKLKSSGAKVLTARHPGGLAVFEVDTTAPPFNNLYARQALSYATNRKAMMAAAYSGLGLTAATNQPVAARSRYFNKKLHRYGYNLAKAKALFAKAGVKPGAKLTFWAIAGAYPQFVTEGEILQQSLAKIGIQLSIKTSDVSIWAAKFYPRGKSYPGLVVANYLSFEPPPDSLVMKWFSSVGTCECNWAPPSSYANALQTYLTSPNQKGREKAAHVMEAMISHYSPIDVIANTSTISVVAGGVQGAWVAPNGNIRLDSAG